MKELGAQSARDRIQQFIESNGIDESYYHYLQMVFDVKDKSKLPWKPQSHFTKLYNTEFDELMKNKDFNIELFGFLMILSSYIGYQDNYLKKKDGTYLTQKDIISITGWGRTKALTNIHALIEHGFLYKVRQEEDQRKSKYYLNPNLFFKGSQIDKEIKEYYSKKNK